MIGQSILDPTGKSSVKDNKPESLDESERLLDNPKRY